MALSARRRVARLASAAFGLALAITPFAAPDAHAQGAWLDQPTPTSWNSVGMAVPSAPSDAYANPRCALDERPAETAEDLALTAAGWRLFREYESGWSLRVILGLAGYDGMCRPTGFQVFVFLGGTFAGTLSPTPMDSRADGSLTESRFLSPLPGENTLSATFNRYTDLDPLCCPSGRATVTYLMERGAAGPVLVPVRAETGPTGP